MCSLLCWFLCVANDSPTLNGCTMRTPTVPVPKDQNSDTQPVPMKRSASVGAVPVDEVHQPSTTHQSTASATGGSACDLRY